ncbi:glycosyl transferase [Leuconostoc mesenteroides subsp. mesenteroides]|uniref:glycosyltransferase n=1 Tax=Leuconostoc mesenteroides TaxID=1245 RepID=UPI0009FDFA3D|nr:glycosyltransferase [Leuconostoc mesenteroides]ARN63891.1 glycosyl transferase [Leuconostoc mesenteroides subsp. mesenteroides]MDV8927391.1 glycosyltransferase [Leuconostoc mesenteroides]ORI91177.1 glycosyl transferase [Leuconostoc mesenteroides subsp. mesenteroides]ORI92842.1 glycosyl transferase [Leuconostoc mesenteroides subsp. mesenteroides]
MTKKVLMLAAKANMIQQFNHRNIKILQDLGYEVHVATNMVDFGSMSAEENERFKQWMNDNKVMAHQVDFERRMGSLKGNIRSLKQLRQIFRENDFNFIHVHSPLGSILGRLVAKQFKVPTIYTAHGFHFFKGGPKSGWLVFYPLEWFFSFITDTLITINGEDYELAKKHMHANKTFKINGIGVDVVKAWHVTDEEKLIARRNVRKELDIPEDAFVMSSVGELSNRKNHSIVLEALKRMNIKERENIYYIIAGTGANGKMLNELAESFSFKSHFKLLGYRSDIREINFASNIVIFPSLQEGLGVSGLETIINGSYLIGSDVRGIRDYILSKSIGTTFSPGNAKQLEQLIKNKINTSNLNSGSSRSQLLQFDVESIDKAMKNIYQNMKST